MIKLETHLHVKGGSSCAHATPKQIVADYLKAGYGGIVVTNHCYAQCNFEYEGRNLKEKLDFYFSLVKAVRKEAEKVGIKVFYGAEVSADRADGRYQEFMLYGFEEDFLYNQKPLYLLNQREIFEIAEKEGLFMYQTHPFRETSVTGEPTFMHGAEAYNGHKGHLNGNCLASEFCDKYNLIKMSGSDYHDFGQEITGGIYIPEDINTNGQLKNFLMSTNFELIKNGDVK